MRLHEDRRRRSVPGEDGEQNREEHESPRLRHGASDHGEKHEDPHPRRTYYTKAYCKKRRKAHRTQQQLAELVIRGLTPILPDDVHLVVVADEYFEGGRLLVL